MRILLTIPIIMLCAITSKAQRIEVSEKIHCEVQVAYAVSEGEDTGEYSITRMRAVTKGAKAEFYKEEFQARRVYSKIDYDEMFIIRFGGSGLTHFVDANAEEGFEKFLYGGCTLQDRIYIRQDNCLYVEAVQR